AAHRLAPPGIYFATEYMSVRSSGGITGIPPGTRLELVQDMGEVARVTTGQVQFDAKKYQLTNDLDIAAEVSSRDAAEQTPISLGQPSEHHETARQKQEVSKRPVQTTAPAGRNPLERGAYGRTQEQTYTDSSGRTYWIDIRGHKHYNEN